eukprot:518160-Prymnesium_polylepis.1
MKIIGNPGQRPTIYPALASQSTVIKIEDGAPPVTIIDVNLVGQVIVEGSVQAFAAVGYPPCRTTTSAS